MAPLTIAVDPDGLLAEAGFAQALTERGYEIQTYEEPLAFRFLYESRWREGVSPQKALVLRLIQGRAEDLPFDLLERARVGHRVLQVNLAGLFPLLDPRVVAEVPKECLEVLAHAHAKYLDQTLGESHARDFILRHVYEVAPEFVRSPADLLGLLLRLHQSNWLIPSAFAGRLVKLLGADWEGWPTARLLESRAEFLDFLQERWPHFLESHLGLELQAEPDQARSEPRVPGPLELPFQDPKVWVHVDSLFLEGQLKPAPVLRPDAAQGKWYAVGLSGDATDDRAERLRHFLEVLHRTIPSAEASPQDWARTAVRWGELEALRYESKVSPSPVAMAGDREDLRPGLEEAFETWLVRNYGHLASLPFLPVPAMLHRVPSWLHHRMVCGQAAKVALVLVDGLSLAQWATLRRTLGDRLTFEEAATFAWIPTMTAVSRQALFAGEPPAYFGSSIGDTSKEEQRWHKFWEGKGYRRQEIAYVRQLVSEDEGQLLERVERLPASSTLRVLGLVVSKVDEILHGAVTGMDGLHVTLRHWGLQGGFRRLLEGLIDQGFQVVLTSDHGNVEAIGCGKANVGATAQSRGERVLVFQSEVLRSAALDQFPGARVWSGPGLPPEYHSLLAPPGQAFTTRGKRCVTHGGASLEEVLVPFVQIGRRP